MQSHIISGKAEGSFQDCLVAIESAAKSAVAAMPLQHKNNLAQAVWQHYLFLQFLQDAAPDATTPYASAAFDNLSTILSEAGITLSNLNK